MDVSSRRQARVRAVVQASGGVLCAAAALGDPPVNGGSQPPAWAAAGVERVAMPTFRGEEMFRIKAADAASSEGWRENQDLADGGQAPDPSGGWLFNSSIIVRAADASTVRKAARLGNGNAPGTVGALKGAPGFFLVTMPNVRSAVQVAKQLRADARISEAYVDACEPGGGLRSPPTDPNYPQQWHLNNTLNPIVDINAESVWESGINGAGVIVGICEFGFTSTHPDLAANFSAANSQSGGVTSHGSSVAGLVAAVRDNGLGGVGAAYGSQISRIYTSTTTPSTNVTAFGFRNDDNLDDGVDENWIKTNSWGPSDNSVIDRMTSAEAAALAAAGTLGRGGRGEVFLWACGNGALASGGGDRVDYDPYASNRFVIAIGALDSNDHKSVYSEVGSSLFVMAPSDADLGTTSDRGIFTTASTNTYTSTFGGTSAASPIAAGAVALVLDARPELTVRDIKHILARSSRKCDPMHAGWITNGGGQDVNYSYGFGAVDAAAAVAMAQSWTMVDPEETVLPSADVVGLAIPDGNIAGLERTRQVDQHLIVESVEVVVDISHTTIGNLRISLTSPSGTESVLATSRTDTTDDYADYVFHTVRCWDEDAFGTWTLKVADEVPGTTGVLNDWSLRIYGTEPPCPGDWNGVDGVDSQDYFDFLDDFFMSDADFNGDLETDSQDFFDFMNAFFLGC